MEAKRRRRGGNLMDDPVPASAGPLGLSRNCDNLVKPAQLGDSLNDILEANKVAAWNVCNQVENEGPPSEPCVRVRNQIAELDKKFCKALSAYDGRTLTGDAMRAASTPAPVAPTPAPVAPTPAPVAPTPAPVVVVLLMALEEPAKII